MKHVYLRVCAIFFFSVFLTLKISAQITLSISSSANVTCNGGSNGSATALVAGGTGPFTYSWNSAPVQTTATANNLAAGSYTCTCTDQFDMSVATATVSITQPPALTATSSFINPSCNSVCNGSASVVASGGTAPYTYAWIPSGPTTSTITGRCAGGYTCTITDANGCTTTRSFTLTQPPGITISMNPISATCGFPNGQITATVSGGPGPYTYSWVPTGGNAATATNLSPGTYTVTVTDANGCTGTALATVGNINGPTISSISFSPNDSICAGQSVQMTPVVTGGTGPYTYNWTNPFNFLNCTSCFSPTSTPTSSVTYTVSVTDANGCTSNGTATIVVGPSVSTSVSSTDPTCNQTNGSSAVTITGGVAPFNILWSNSATTPSISNLAAGAYSVNVTDANGCQGQSVFGLSNVGGPTVSPTSSSTGCSNFNNGSATANATGLAPFTYLWNTVPAQTTAMATALATGNYLVTVTDNVGCVTVGSANVTSLAGNLFLGIQSYAFSNCAQPTGILYANVAGGTQPYTYAWSNGNTTSTPNALATGTYSLTVTDANGCQTSGQGFVQALCANIAQGKVYFDFNANCVFDAGDYPVVSRIVGSQPGSFYASTNNLGDYSLNIFTNGNALITPPTLAGYTTVCPAPGNYNVNFSGFGDTLTTLDFALQALPNFQDLSISLVSGIARPGFSQLYSIYYTNNGSYPMSDTIYFTHDSILTLISTTQPFTSYTSPSGYWTYTNLLPMETRTIHLYMQVPTIQNGGYLGRQLFSTVNIGPIQTDLYSPDNGDEEIDIIVGSYDPNAKECWSRSMSTMGMGNIQQTDTLAYMIQFQNSGTDTAFTVVVRDSLPSEINPASIMIGASSHPYEFSMEGAQGTNIITFRFNNILLPDSNRNEPASHGYVKFKCLLNNNIPLGTVIRNQADNYFDFNLPIETNSTSDTIPLFLTLPEINSGIISAYPNPFDEAVTLILPEDFKGKNCEVILTDVQGRIVLTQQKQNATSIIIQRGQLEAGIYFCTIRCEGQLVGNKKLIIK